MFFGLRYPVGDFMLSGSCANMCLFCAFAVFFVSMVMGCFFCLRAWLDGLLNRAGLSVGGRVQASRREKHVNKRGEHENAQTQRHNRTHPDFMAPIFAVKRFWPSRLQNGTEVGGWRDETHRHARVELITCDTHRRYGRYVPMYMMT